MDETSRQELSHFGVKGMRWGVRRSSGSSSSRSSKTQRTPAQQAKFDKYVYVGKQVTRAVLITAGTIAVASVAGPIVAAGAGAAARAITARNVELSQLTTDANRITREANTENRKFEALNNQLGGLRDLADTRRLLSDR